MTDYDENAWVREFEHVEAKQRQPVERTWADEMVDMLFDNSYSEVKDDNNEINNQ